MSNKTRVWDPLIRIFHWSLVLAFITSYLTADDNTDVHVVSGYIIIGLLIFRILWGYIGTRTARFSQFLRPPSETMQYIKSLIALKPKRYLGHNPAGAWMIMALIFSLTITTLSGLKLYAVEEGAGPLANIQLESIRLSPLSSAMADSDSDNQEEAYDEDEFWEESHEFFANLTLLLVFLHIGGVLLSSRLHKENLLKAMITGNKTRLADTD